MVKFDPIVIAKEEILLKASVCSSSKIIFTTESVSHNIHIELKQYSGLFAASLQ